MKKNILILLALFLASLNLHAQQIGKLDNNAAADGDFSKWTEIPAIRYGSPEHLSTPLQWNGAEDASMSIKLGWKEGFLCIAGFINDDSDTPDDKLEIGLNAKPKSGLFAKDTLLLHIVPGSGKQVFRTVKYKNLPKNVSGCELIEDKFIKKEHGYSFELYIPFTLIPNFISPEKSGISFQARLTDGDQKRIYPQMLDRTKGMTHFKFAEKAFTTPDEKDAELYTNLNFPASILDRKQKYRLEIAENLIKKNGSISLRAGDKKAVFKKSDLKAGEGYLYAESVLDLTGVPDGDFKVIVSVSPDGKDAAQLSITQNAVMLAEAASTLLPDTLAHLEKLDLPKLAGKDPFRASSYFAIVSALEWLKWGLIQKQAHAITEADNEIRARLNAIEGRPLPKGGTSVYSLLEMTRNPEAQLVVEYFRERKKQYPFPGSISLHFGNFDLVSCMFSEYKTPEEAVKSLAKIQTLPHVKKSELAGTAIWDVPQTVKEPSGELLVSPKTGTFFFTLGNIRFELPYISRDAALKFAGIIISGKAATVEQRDAIRNDILNAIGRTPRKLNLPEGIEVFCGDNHSHTFLSDGRTTPLTVTAQALYLGLDYHIMSDHGVYKGAIKYANDVLNRNGLNFPVGIGIELNSKWGHMNVYPVPAEGGYSFGPTFKDMVDAAHSISGAVIQWNHPDTDYSNLPEYLANGLAGSGLDAWEHYPPHYSKWKKEGRLPVITGGTDTHNGTFHMPERSVMFIKDANCSSIAKGVKENKIVMLDPWNGAYTITRGMENKSTWDSDLFFYGSDEMIQLAVDCLADKDYLLNIKKKRIAGYLEKVDVKSLVNASDAYETVK